MFDCEALEAIPNLYFTPIQWMKSKIGKILGDTGFIWRTFLFQVDTKDLKVDSVVKMEQAQVIVFPQVDANQLGELRSEEHCFSTEGIYDEEAVGLW